VTHCPYAVLEWVEGEPLAHAASRAGPAGLQGLGQAVGAVLAGIHSIRFDRHGFLTPDLRVPTAIDLDRAGLLAFLQRSLRDSPGGARLGEQLTLRLLAFAEGEAGRLGLWLGQPCLVHADFNLSNILVQRDGAYSWRVSAVLDWEFALSATPAFDFGNLLRPPLGQSQPFLSGLAEGYRAAGGFLPEDWPALARIADLFAWADLLGQTNDDPALLRDARRAVCAIIEGAGVASGRRTR
jgi:aminoglycoside phosphotransferase (APT) family kinase protein